MTTKPMDNVLIVVDDRPTLQFNKDETIAGPG